MAMTDEQKERMRAGRQAAKERRLAAKAAEPEEHFPAPEIAEPSSPTSFDLFLASVDAQTRELFNDDELAEIYAAQLAKAKADKKAAAKKRLTEQANHVSRMAEGMIPAAAADELERVKRNNELVEAVIEMPPTGQNGEVGDIGLRIDQRILLDGTTHTMTRAQWDSYREMLYRAGQMEMTFNGQNLRQRRWIMGNAQGRVDRHVPLKADGTLQ